MGTVKKDRKEYGTCRCGKSIVSVSHAGTCWRHEDFERCLDGGWPKEATGTVRTLDLDDGYGNNQAIPEPVRTRSAEARFPVGEVWWCQPEQRPRTLYRGGRIVKVDGDQVTLEPLAPEELKQSGAPGDPKWNLDEPLTLPAEWMKQRIK